MVWSILSLAKDIYGMITQNEWRHATIVTDEGNEIEIQFDPQLFNFALLLEFTCNFILLYFGYINFKLSLTAEKDTSNFDLTGDLAHHSLKTRSMERRIYIIVGVYLMLICVSLVVGFALFNEAV